MSDKPFDPQARLPAMTRLAHVQKDFQSFLLRAQASVEAHVVGTERVGVATRLGIYGNGYRLRLIEALQSNYPVLAKLLGEADFETLATEYVRAHDSRFFSVRYYGDRLAEFLARDPNYTSAPILAELARWEWAMTEVFDAADAEPINGEALARVAADAWAQLRFSWHPAMRRLDLVWNAPQIWKALSGDSCRPEASLQAQPVHWLLWRQELSTYFRSLAPAEAALLDAARDGQTFGELCVLLCAYCEEQQAPAQAASFLRAWLGSGLIITAR